MNTKKKKKKAAKMKANQFASFYRKEDLIRNEVCTGVSLLEGLECNLETTKR